MGLFRSGSGDGRGLNAYNVWVLMFVSFGSVTYGYAASIIGTTLGQPSFLEYYSLETRPNGTDLLASTNGLFQTGGVIGTLCLPFFADRWGRKCGLGVSALLVIIAGAVLAGSTHIAEFLAFRFVSGMGTFMILAAVPIWMSEVVPPHLRGALVNVHGISLVTGYAIQGWVGFGCYFWKDGGISNTWRVPLSLQCLWPLILCAGLWWVPESPRWLILNDRADEAKTILFRLHAHPSDPHNRFARAELYQIQKQIDIDRTLNSGWWHILRKPSLRKRALLTLGTTGFGQFSGVLVINNYGPTLYRNLGFSVTKQLLYPAAWLTFAAGLNVMAAFLVDHFPRNKYISAGVLGCMVTLIIEAALTAEYVKSTNSAALQAAVAMLFLFVVPYSWCIDGPQFTYISELWPNHLRAKGMSLGVAMISLMNIMWLQAAPTAFATIGWRFYLCFIIPGTIGGIVMWVFFPDTNGRPLEEVAALFGDEDEVAVYQQEIDATGEDVFDSHTKAKEHAMMHVEDAERASV